MPDTHKIEEMAEKAKYRAGWAADLTYRPLTDGDGLGAVQPDIDVGKERETRAHAEGVEAALLWALGRTGEPLPR
jgi:hypothetical protein